MSTFVRNIGLRKRKTVKSRGYKHGPEIKQKDFFEVGSTYNAWACVPFARDLAHRIFRPFELISISWPTSGSSADSRIGYNINMRWIRFKGYCTVYDRLITNCKLKLYLVRSYGRSLDDAGFVALYKNWEAVDYGANDVWGILNAMRHNYYKAIVDIDKVGRNKGVVISKIGEIKIHPSSHSMDAWQSLRTISDLTGSIGASSNAIITTPVIPSGNTFEFESIDNIPFDLKISLHETIDVNNDHYYLFVMQDYPYVSDNTPKPNTYYPAPTKSSGYELNFFGRYYYTDY